MKIGVLILAHNNPNQLKQLVDILKTDFQIFIHLDKKSCIDSDIFANEPNVCVIKNHKVYWGSVNIVLATLDLIKLAFEHNCDYYILISGSDLPILKNQDIIKEIRKNPEISYFDYHSLPREDWPLNGGFERLQLFWEKIEKPNVTSYSIKSLLFSLCRNIQRVFHLKRKLLPVTYYGGAQWFNLSKEAVEYLLNYIEENPKFLKSFNYTLISDEIFFHTLLLNSPIRHKIENDKKRYIDWDTGPERPRILRIEDYDKIIKSNGFFARKFDEKIDDEICKKILQRINL